MHPSNACVVARRAATHLVWAVRDVGFEVAAGEIVGIIGRNGAGKSTLLKLLSRITEPTTGRIELYGRIGSLLEVGTGFHPELTGRENIFLNGAILGMKRAEIARKFDEIVAFAEVAHYIDTAVKRYSSGMYLRLAFAVAAHLEPEILVVDEVLAVGDARFQRKCLDKMQEVGRQGRTVLFVSHNMTAVTRLCPRTILLNEGGVVADGASHTVVGTYLNSGLGTTARREWADGESAPGNEVVRLRGVRVRGGDGEVTDAVDIRQRVGVEVEFEVLEGGRVLVPNLWFYNEEGAVVFSDTRCRPGMARESATGRDVHEHGVGSGKLPLRRQSRRHCCDQPHVPSVEVHVLYGEAVAFQVIDSLDGDSARGDYAGPMPGIVRPLLRWETRYSQSQRSTHDSDYLGEFHEASY